MAKHAKPAQVLSALRARLHALAEYFAGDYREYFGRPLRVLRNRWVMLGLVVLLALFSVYNRESIRATVSEHVGQSCGTLGRAPDRLVDAASRQQVTSCFMQAYTTCQAATMDFTRWWMDGSARYTFVIEPAFGPVACGLALLR